MVKRKAVRYFGGFLAVMLVMTFVSRMVYTKNLAVVTAEKVRIGRLSKNIQCCGTAEATAVKTVSLPEGLTVEKLTAPAGSKVSVGEELLRLDMAKLRETAEKLAREIDDDIMNGGLGGSGEVPVFTESDMPVKSVKVKAGDKVSVGSELFTLNSDRLLMLINELEAVRNEDIIGRNGEDSLSTDGETVQAELFDLSISEKQKKIDRYLKIYNAGGKVCAESEGTVTAVNIKAGDLTGQTAAVVISGQAKTTGSTAAKQEQLDKLNDLMAQQGAVLSPAEGIVTKVSVQAGDVTGGGAAVCIADNTEPMVFNADLSGEDGRLLAVGDSASLSFRNGRINLTDNRIAAMTRSEDGQNYRLTLPLESDEIVSGEVGQLTAGAACSDICECVPNRAVKGSGREKYIYLLKKEEGFLGEEYHAERIDVETVMSNENSTALKNTGLTEEDMVICTDKELKDGQTVRVSKV
ncbi:hypothetical protein [Ruminococcus sp.]|uniref:hypothetical protein n=1 Tax=Ruminococcus sp. TaxID=41978 RepID=UPI0025DB6BFB|nr:hypothetical protein [Ruminococcus sp.]MBQ8966028.1 hypothetical protein [Ruminococcus sp.]